jgi:hypothetical protein
MVEILEKIIIYYSGEFLNFLSISHLIPTLSFHLGQFSLRQLQLKLPNPLLGFVQWIQRSQWKLFWLHHIRSIFSIIFYVQEINTVCSRVTI